MNKQWIQGTEYDLDSSDDVANLMDYIDNAKKRGASGDLHMCCYGILVAYVTKQQLKAEAA